MAVVIEGGRRFDSRRGAFEDNGSLVIEGGKIVSVDRGGEVGNAQVIDASGKTVIPGLMNLHGHLAWDGFSDLEKQTRFDGPMGYLKVARGLRAAVEAGVTTFRDLACVHDTGLFARQAVRDGLLPGPTVYACGRAVCRTGGHIWWGNREADGADEVRRAVREQARAGVDWIKLMSHGYTREEIDAAVDQAHQEGLPITTDAGDWAALAVEAGVDCIEHGGNYSDELIETIRAKGIWIVPTLSPVVLQARKGSEWGMKASVIERRKRQLESSGRHEGLVRAKRAGVRLAFGTDSGSPVVPHDAILAEMEALLEFGIFDRPEEVLQAATYWAAECLGLEEQTGSLEAGKDADVVVIGGKLEEELSRIEQVETVFVKGHLTVEGGCSKAPDPRDFQTFVEVGA
ncbi:MAG: amidohydrolase family protein [Trueperaceae bacterium]|nr:MAG: amidohydrolase family protein [Trueperaceae bacterium]